MEINNSSPAKSFKERVEELEKGCGRKVTYNYSNEPYGKVKTDTNYKCGDEKQFPNGKGIKLCPSCQAELKALQEGYQLGLKQRDGYISKEEIEDVLDNFDINKFLDSKDLQELFSTDYSENEMLDYFKDAIKQSLKLGDKNGMDCKLV